MLFPLVANAISSQFERKKTKEFTGGTVVMFDEINNIGDHVRGKGQLSWKSRAQQRTHQKGAQVHVEDLTGTSCLSTTEFDREEGTIITPSSQTPPSKQKDNGPGVADVRRSDSGLTFSRSGSGLTFSRSDSGLSFSRRDSDLTYSRRDSGFTLTTIDSVVGKINGSGSIMHYCLVNERRGENLRRLTPNLALYRLAELQAQAMADEGRVFHSNPNFVVNGLLPESSSLGQHMDKVGENVFKIKGTNDRSMASANKKILKAMTQDVANNANLFDPDYRFIGMAMASDRKGVAYMCILFLG